MEHGPQTPEELREALEVLVTYAQEGDEFTDPTGDPDRYTALKAAELVLWGDPAHYADPAGDPQGGEPGPPRWRSGSGNYYGYTDPTMPRGGEE